MKFITLTAVLLAATGCRDRATYRCVLLDGQVVETQLREDALTPTPFGLVVMPAEGRPFVASTCQEINK